MSHTTGRRAFLKFSAAVAAGTALPDNLRRAMAIAPNRVTGTIRDVEHVVILMQENRSFDHYFGCLQGVRGYGDPRAEQLPDGNSVFSQPDGKGGRVMPFMLDTAHTSSACIASLDHNWKGTQTAWNDWDTWVPHKTPMTMGHFTRAQIPYYYALADAFTICDAYHASIFGPTNPNRLFLFSGTSGLAAGNTGKQVIDNCDDGNWSADMAHDHPDFEPFRWSTYPEKLQAAGVSWRVYQEYDNFGDNPLASFAQFRNLDTKSWAYRRARMVVRGSNAANMHQSEGRYLIRAFEHDVAHGTLPQVSWIVPPAALSEHPNAPPGYGEHLISQLMDVFVRHPDVWAKTVFILNYDENDGFFDHMPPPVPALDPAQGASSVTVDGESYHGVPVGLGPRVPTIVVSPWTKGGWVNSQVFDHTSVLRFLEARFGVEAPYITPWRRVVCGDMTSIFDFAQTDRRWQADLPRTDTYLAQTRQSCTLPLPTLPTQQALPQQESGQRRARALPYALHADLLPTGVLRLANTGAQGAVLRIRDAGVTRHYTLDAGHDMDVRVGTPHVPGMTVDITVHGPNGFFRRFAGKAPPGVALRYDPVHDAVVLSLHNPGHTPQKIQVDDAYARTTQKVIIPPGGNSETTWPVTASDCWYDLTLHIPHHGHDTIILAGHMENGRPSRTDPHMGQQQA
ncbi:phosphocholine-specific phospholipase C [Novacetimonas hansenii]|uniref:phosphocholine-specific phospholipase C n=1 Tax=Novacetimonas hansenii TaxID=436 RepID=UPI000AA760A9|nr:phospholipase C, phosphocholine-specific [Novacetimonas hansenii]